MVRSIVSTRVLPTVLLIVALGAGVGVASAGQHAQDGQFGRTEIATEYDSSAGPFHTAGSDSLTDGHAVEQTAGFGVESSSNVTREQVLSGVDQPTSVVFLPDGRMLVLQKNGEVQIVDPASGNSQLYMNISDRVETRGERGLIDVTLDPDFESNGYVYVYYTNSRVSGPGTNRISRFTHVENSGGLSSNGNASSEFLVWENPSPTKDCCHFGGGLDVGPDGALYLTTGEEFDGEQAQNLSKADGKIIRVNRDGTIPQDNPFVDDADALDEIWALGLRNPFRAEWDLQSERLFIGEVGGNNDSIAQEDIHLGRKGANYGWPECQGFCENPAYDDPIYSYAHNGSGASVTGGFVYRGTQFPAEYNGSYVFGDYVNGWIKYLSFNSSGAVESVDTLSNSAGSVASLTQGPDGSIYYADIRNGTVTRLAYSSSNQGPELSDASANVTTGNSPLAVSFTGEATDPDGDALTYRWVFGDGTETTGQNVTHTYTESGQYSAFLEVSDGNVTVVSDPIQVRAGSAPNATIVAPANRSLFRAGDTLTFIGNGTDPDDGTLDGSDFSWTMRFLHDEHTHPVVDASSGRNLTYQIPTSGHDYSSDTGYRITLTVTDSDGVTDSDTVVVVPDKANLTMRTDPSGLEFRFDDVTRTGPYTHDSLIGFDHRVSASDQCVDGTQYAFRNWSDGGAQSHTITTPENDTTYTANYVVIENCTITEPTDQGLVLRLESDRGVTTNASTVEAWVDQSDRDNDLTASGGPTLVSDVLNGQAVVSFDGTDDVLRRNGSLDGFSTGDADRTLAYVVRYNSTGFGGLTYGSDSCNRAFGPAVSDTGALVVQGWCGANDFTAPVQGAGAGWMTHTVVLNNDSFTHLRNGSTIDRGVHTFNTTDDKLVLGAEMDPPAYVEMDVAAVFAYNRSLSESERQDLRSYLQNKYFTGTRSVNNQPIATDDSASVEKNESVTIDVLANDDDPDGSLNVSSVTVQQPPANGTLSVNASTGTITYTHDGSNETRDSFSYTVADRQGATSNEATVVINGEAGDADLGSVARMYDTNDDGTIDINELGEAAADYIGGGLTIIELGEVGAAYVGS